MGTLLPCATLEGEPLYNRDAEELGELEHVVIDVPSGRIAYAVLVRGGVLGLGERLHAIPWEALEIDAEQRRFVLDIGKERLEAAPGFDEEHWPAMTDAGWAAAIREFYSAIPRHM
jgi:sporulation protein YlmC with PRC-barrel domain